MLGILLPQILEGGPSILVVEAVGTIEALCPRLQGTRGVFKFSARSRFARPPNISKRTVLRIENRNAAIRHTQCKDLTK